MNLPVTPGFLDVLSAGPSPNPTYLDGSVGTHFITPDQLYFRSTRRHYGEGDPDIGGYKLSSIHFDKESGTTTVGQMDVGPSGWYGGACDCADAGGCGCG